MADSRQTKRGDRSLVGVYDTDAGAEKAAEKARRAGVPDRDIRVGAEGDDVASMRAEMQQEMDDSWLSPQAAFAYTKESAKGLALLMPVLTVIGAVVALPLGFIEFGDIALWLRLVIAGLTGAAAGATIALIAGPALGVRKSTEPVAAQRGKVVRVDEDSPDVARSMAEEEPVRLDEVRSSDGTRVTTLTTDEQQKGKRGDGARG